MKTQIRRLLPAVMLVAASALVALSPVPSAAAQNSSHPPASRHGSATGGDCQFVQLGVAMATSEGYARKQAAQALHDAYVSWSVSRQLAFGAWLQRQPRCGDVQVRSATDTSYRGVYAPVVSMAVVAVRNGIPYAFSTNGSSRVLPWSCPGPNLPWPNFDCLLPTALVDVR
jgi:hypothetical protein